MSHTAYDYSTRKGIRLISWEDFHGICKALAQAVAPYAPQMILPIGRGGYYPGTLLSHLLQVEVYPVRISRRVNDVPQYDSPRWLVEPPAGVRDQRVLIVDEICGIGETIGMVRARVESLGAAQVRSAVMYAHTWGVHVPDYIGIVSDELLLNPWDREVYREGGFQFHPEYVGALAQQDIAPSSELLIPVPQYVLAKSIT